MVSMTLIFFISKALWTLAHVNPGEYDLITGTVNFLRKRFGSFKLDIDN